MGDNPPLMTYNSWGEWDVWKRETATGVQGEIAAVAAMLSKEGGGAGANLKPDKLALHSGRTPKLAARGVPKAGIKKKDETPSWRT